MTQADIDLQTYLDRIGYTGSRDITLDVLSALLKQHMAMIPFEALDVLLDRGVDLNPAAVDDKMLSRHRGGYCFEHTSPLRRALQAIGFDVRQHLARVWIGGNPEQDPPRPASHTSLAVTVGGACWLVYAGFGGFTPTAIDTNYGAYRLRETRDGTLLESRFQDQWAPLYEVLDFNWQAVDFKVANHFRNL